MNKKGTNRSVLRTQKMLKQGLTELLLQKPIQQISVKELCDYVDLNRGTFYLHYRDIYDLLEQLENEMLERFETILSEHAAEQRSGNPFPLLKDVFRLLGESSDFCRMVLGKNRDWNFIVKLESILKERCFYDWKTLFQTADEGVYEVYYSFIISGCIGIAESWLFGDMKKTPEELASLAETIILHGVEHMK